MRRDYQLTEFEVACVRLGFKNRLQIILAMILGVPVLLASFRLLAYVVIFMYGGPELLMSCI